MQEPSEWASQEIVPELNYASQDTYHTLPGTFTISGTHMPPNNMVFSLKGEEVLRLAPDAFYVRKKKLEQDESEARQLFDAMLEFFHVAKSDRNT